MKKRTESEEDAKLRAAAEAVIHRYRSGQPVEVARGTLRLLYEKLKEKK